MRYAIVTDGLIVNIAEAKAPQASNWIEAPDGAAIGDLWDGKQFARPPAPAPDPLKVSAEAANAIQQLLDGEAQAHGYDSILSAISYADSINPKWAVEAAACKAWRDAVWMTAAEIQDAVLAGKQPLPTAAEVLARMPAIAWPE